LARKINLFSFQWGGEVFGSTYAGVGTGSGFPGYPADPDARPGTKDDPGRAGQPGSAGEPGTRVAKYQKCSRRGRKGKEKKGKRRKREDDRMSIPLERLWPFLSSADDHH
jgi:hypothetical protein